MLSRRELLATFLGAPFALSGCGGSSDTPPLPPGEIVGASAGIGHRLRDGLRVRVADEQWQRVGVVIVGGGPAGLSAGRRLAQGGVDDFVVLELEPRAGGTSRSGESGLVAYPWGAHYVPVPMKENTDLVELLDEMEVLEGRDEAGEPIVAEQFLCRAPQERIFYEGRWHQGLYVTADATAADLEQFAAFQKHVGDWAGWRDAQGRRAFALPMATGSDDAEVTALDRISMADWMDERQLTSPKLRWYLDHACRDDYGLTLDQTSAWAGLFYFASRKPNAETPSQPFITWPEGNGCIVRHLAEPLREKIQLGWAVANIQPQLRDGRRTVRVTAVSHDGSQTRGYIADRVIFSAPRFLAKYLIEPWRTAPPAHLSEFTYGAWAVANLHLSDRPDDVESALCWDNVIHGTPSLGYVTATHQRGLDYGPTIFTWYYPLCDADPAVARNRLLDNDRDAWAEIALADLERAHTNIRQLVTRLDVMRWGHAMIRPVPGFIWGQARREAGEPFEGIYFAHSDLSGLALFEEAFHRGNQAADEVITALRG